MDIFFDCFSGISGDMTLGALIDLGAPRDRLVADLKRLEGIDFTLESTPVLRNGINAKQVNVRFEASATHRSFSELVNIIQSSPLSLRVRSLGEAIFRRIAVAESEIHGCALDEVHFHEVGAVDAVVDIVGTALCLDYLGIKHVAASRIALGSGVSRCRHGAIPIPAPATASILKDIPVYGAGVPHELTTPTGAAIIATIAQRFGDLPDMKISGIGYGAGSRVLEDRPNLLRVLAGTFEAPEPDMGPGPMSMDRVVMLESAVDDMSPELLGYLMEKLFEDGALDVLWIPVYMKKNRPGTLIQVLCRETDEKRLALRVLSETTVTGVRMIPANRRILFRESMDVQTAFGSVRAKRIVGPDGEARLVPEYEECRRIAMEQGLPIREVYERIQRELTSVNP